MEVAILIWIVCGFGAGWVASSRGRGGCAWFAIGFLLGPIGLGAAFLIPNDGQSGQPSRADRAALQDGKARKCPSCLSIVPNEARKCRYCACDLPAPPRRDLWGRERD